MCPKIPIQSPEITAFAVYCQSTINYLSVGRLEAAAKSWAVGMRRTEVLLSKTARLSPEWVEACIPLFKFASLLGCGQISEGQSQLLTRAVEQCIEVQSRLREGTERKEAVIRVLWLNYIIHQLKQILYYNSTPQR